MSEREREREIIPAVYKQNVFKENRVFFKKIIQNLVINLKFLYKKMSANKRKNLNAMEEDPSGSVSETSSDDEDDGPHPDAYTGNEVSCLPNIITDIQ